MSTPTRHLPEDRVFVKTLCPCCNGEMVQVVYRACLSCLVPKQEDDSPQDHRKRTALFLREHNLRLAPVQPDEGMRLPPPPRPDPREAPCGEPAFEPEDEEL